ncbi:hypothetical protein [Erwinia sorbitola]|uniref:Uncharacterized protein n=1 Tax=Erwinia sorbitola TaxID=2681984 RepID=A0A6I6EZA5_9GAMM|nr:hypothetical protein [Erwinia sorbitola]QGU86980.1 hypothetical protein GN242_07020 [Erwinia sorbitola]
MSYVRRNAIYEQEQEAALQKALERRSQQFREALEARDAILAAREKQAAAQSQSPLTP